MLVPRVARVSALRGTRLSLRRLPVVQQRFFFPPSLSSPEEYEKRYPAYPSLTEEEDPEMNGGYVNPPRIPRQFRDPYGDWWDKQERRNFGEPVHMDHDVLGALAPHEYTWTTPGRGLAQLGASVLVFLSVCGAVYLTYPDKPSYPREFEEGLQRELGGAGALRARKAGDPDPF